MANPYFNAASYLALNQDLVIAGITTATAEQHYDAYGAAEGRAPNTWFDAEAYLLANPDLIAGGVTLANALQHFATYGVLEARTFNNNPALVPSNFDAEQYAEDNTDVADLFGITDPADLTDVQKGQLMGHFLAYGLYENREGAGTAFEDAAKASSTITIDPTSTAVTVGTSGDDTFKWATAANTDTVSINGLAGTDTLEIATLTGTDVKATVANIQNIDIAAVNDGVAAPGTGAVVGKLTVTGSGVQNVAVADIFTGGSFTYVGALVESLTVEGGGTVTATLSGVSGSSDTLAVAVDAASTVNLSGIETVNLDLDADTTGLVTLNVNKVNGDTLAVNVTGGEADGTVTLVVESTGSADLTTATVDASAVASDVTIDLSTTDLVNVDVTISTGAGSDTIETGVATGQVGTVNAGAGNDTITAADGQDVVTGGAGADIFDFSTAGSAVLQLNDDGDEILAVDTVTDFKDTTSGAVTETVKVTVGAAAAADGGLGTIGTVASGILEFATGYLAGKTLTDVVIDLSNNVAAADMVAFNFDGDAYVFVSDGVTASDDISGDEMVKLIGVDAADLNLGSADIVFA